MTNETLYAEVVLPLHLRGTFTYRVPSDYADVIAVGQRVVVQFGQKKLYSALVVELHNNVPSYKAKYILSITDAEPLATPQQFRLWRWMADYYMCYLGDVMAAALPSAFKLASESSVTISPDFSGELSDLSDKELRIVNLLSEHPVLKVNDISVALGVQKIMPVINSMIERNIVVMDEDLRQRFTPKKVSYITLAPQYLDSDKARELFNSLERKKSTQKQVSLLLRFMQLSDFGQKPVAKRDLLDSSEASASSLSTLIRNEVLLQEEHFESRLQTYASTTPVDSISLNDEQQAAYDSIIANPGTTLLHGVTSSGKTEVYIKLIQHTLDQGKQALFLLPEIALTSQIINRLRKYFGDRVGVYHSRFSPSQRAEVWNRTKNAYNNSPRYDILLGARSALFLPFQDLGLVIVDEEHDSSYKQYEPTPRYNARDSALYLAHLWQARAVLGSATPSMESYYNAKNGKYSLVEMQHRYGGLQLPEVLCVDMKDAHRKKEVQGQHFSNFLLNHIAEALQNHEQVILFQNRRGYSLRIECDDCHWIPQCQHCDVSLVYHRSTNSLRCHYCGYSIPMPTECPVCHSKKLSLRGIGTERIEDDLHTLFPQARIERMDLDSTMQKNRHIEILNDFEDRRIDILVGTQMVTKGLDFDNVSVVGIISADNLNNFPDFRAFERSFQQMMQVAGRAGRHGHQGKVVIQTYNPWHQAIRNVIDNNYEAMYLSQLNERRVFSYPPFFKLIDITLKHRDTEVLNQAADKYAGVLRSKFATRVVGPEYPSVSRIRNAYIKKILIRFNRTENIAEAKSIIAEMADDIQKLSEYRNLSIIFDVDPQ